MGTVWKISLYETIQDNVALGLEDACGKLLDGFDRLYSRFKDDSLVSHIAKTPGMYEVPKDFTAILSIYKKVYKLSHKKFTPCIGGLLEDVGYDKEYSLQKKDTFREVPDFDNVVIIDDTHIKTQQKVLLDVGAVGKGYCVDLVTQYLREIGYKHFLVDGSGDVFYEGETSSIRVGLEHPGDTTKVIGVIDMKRGAMCSSATNRRAWGNYTHYIDPESKSSPTDIVATWVIAETAAYADALSSLLFFVSPEKIADDLPDVSFSFCIMNHENKIKKSQDFSATFF